MSTVIDEDEVKTALAANTIRLRKLKGWSQDELASRAGISRVQINRIENAHVDPRATAIFSLADAFGVPVDSLRVVCENSSASA
jgi:transcriptional regulator with XRE-family HTH domain